MRFKQYIRKFVGNGAIESVPFGPEHFKEVGLAPTPIAGMPMLEAYQLVNKWNIQQANPRFVYCLE